ncbi:MAG TPA: CPBP family intramembrane glutamic endopeptidase [Terriglobales bacterium]|jgi:membrane protease YdiL (CAAX protease family)|nr:CPBP family intramembrane glutamic endopeptidase [Terriglobales bacterium]
MQNVTAAAVIAFVMELAPAVAFGFAAERIARRIQRWPVTVRLIVPSVCALPYVLISVSAHIFRWQWFALYLALPVAIAWLLEQAAAADPEQRGNWRDAIILLALGLSVDLRWFDGAWPSGLQALNKLLLVDVGLYGFLAIRQLSGVGFDFRFCWSDWKTGLRELIFFTPFVLTLGLALGFIHPHSNRPQVGTAIVRWVLTFLFTALPEELFFRGWVQNLLERRMGRRMALAIASVLFGLSHFNKRAAHFNWRYVLLAAIAGIFYGRAWSEQRRVAASTITHASVDWIWGLWF